MRPYYQDDAVTIYHGDCREMLAWIPADVCVTDPPYDAITHRGAKSLKNGRFGGASDLIDYDPMTADRIAEIFGLMRCRRWCVATMDYRHVSILEGDPPSGLRFVRYGVWTKRDYAPQFTGDRPAMGWEAVAIFHGHVEKMRWNGGGRSAVWHTKIEKNNALVPGQKPLPLIQSFIDLFSDYGETVLDPFMGSGTTLRAAKDLGRRAIGIEIEERYCEIAAKRCAQEVLAL